MTEMVSKPVADTEAKTYDKIPECKTRKTEISRK